MVSSSARFTGSVPTYYDRYLGPGPFEPYAADLVRRLPHQEDLRVLEIACGTGIVTRRLRDALPTSATLVATDLNEAMLIHAQAALAPRQGIQWQTADAEALPFQDASFDVVVCQFGVMFLPDKPAGFREARRVLAEDGLLLANVWHSIDENPFARAMQTRLEKLFPDDPPRFFETPYGYAIDRVRADLAEAGWTNVRLEDIRLTGVSPTVTEFATGFGRGSPLSHQIVERGGDLDEVVAELAEALIPVGGENPFNAQLVATVITAIR